MKLCTKNNSSLNCMSDKHKISNRNFKINIFKEINCMHIKNENKNYLIEYENNKHCSKNVYALPKAA